jgi:hypothetical protein
MNYYEIAKTLMQIERNHHEDMFSWIEDVATNTELDSRYLDK